MRVAFATRRGTTVDEHFGRAAAFAVYEVSADGHDLVELRRLVDGDLDVGVVETRGAGAVHDDAVERKIERLGDCRIVYFTEIGGPSAAKLVQHGIMPLRTADGSLIENEVAQLVDRIRTNPPPWMRRALDADAALKPVVRHD